MKASNYLGSSVEIKAAEEIFSRGGDVIDYFEAILSARQKALQERAIQIRKELEKKETIH